MTTRNFIQLRDLIRSNIPDNRAQEVSPEDIRDILLDLIQPGTIRTLYGPAPTGGGGSDGTDHTHPGTGGTFDLPAHSHELTGFALPSFTWQEELDWEPDRLSALNATPGNTLFEIPMDFNPPLTEAEDDGLLEITATVGGSSSNRGEDIRSVALNIRSRIWRLGGNTAATTTAFADVDFGFTTAAFDSSNSGNVANWFRGIICKGPNGRIAFSFNNNFIIHHVRVRELLLTPGSIGTVVDGGAVTDGVVTPDGMPGSGGATGIPGISTFDSAGVSDIAPGDHLIINIGDTYYRIDIEPFAEWVIDNHISDWAHSDNTDLIPADKLPSTHAGDITAVIAGTGLMGGGTSGDITISLAGEEYTPAEKAALASVPNWVTDPATEIPGTKLPDTHEGDITSVVAGTGLSGGGTTGDVTLDVENPFTTADEAKLDGLGAEGGYTVQSGNLTAVTAPGGETEANRIPSTQALGAITGDDDLLQVSLASTGSLTLVLTGLDNKYTGRTFEIGGNHLKFSQANNFPDGANNRITYVFMGDYSDWVIVGSQSWSIVAPLGLATATVDGLLSSAGFTKLGNYPENPPDPLSDAQIKTQYEANPDTNALTDAEKVVAERLANLTNVNNANKFAGWDGTGQLVGI